MMKTLSRLFATALAALPIAGQAQASCDPGEEVLKFSVVTALQGHPKGEAAMAFSEQINKEFQGRFCMEVYGNSELYPDDDTLFAAMLNNDVHFAAPAVAKLGAYTNKFELFNLPFLFDGPLHVMEFLNSEIAEGMSDEVRAAGFEVMGLWANGMRQMSATVPIRGPQDAAGLTFRVSSSSPVTAEVLRIMQITPKKLSFSKVYDALKSGEVQGQENTWANIQTKGFYLEQAAVTETNHTYIGYSVIASRGWLNSLDAETREKMVGIMKLVTHERNRFAFEINQERRQDILDDDGIIITLTPAELDEWRRQLKPVWDQFSGVIGTDLINAAVAINAQADPYN